MTNTPTKYGPRSAQDPTPGSNHYPFFRALQEGHRIWRDDPLNDEQEWLTLDHPGIQGNPANIVYFGSSNLTIPLDTKSVTEAIAAHFDQGIDDLVFCAFRYYLGRMTASTCFFAESLAKAWPLLRPEFQGLIRKELEFQFHEDDVARHAGREHHRPLGHDCDREAWELVRAAYQQSPC